MIVQIAANRVNIKDLFLDYAILGDDIVIGNKAVADAYLSIMHYLGVEINLSKSLVSELGVAEFAKRLIKEDIDISPVSPKSILTILNNIRELPTLIRDLVSRGYPINKDWLSDKFNSFKTELPFWKRGSKALNDSLF